jgi:hypothetical protein
MCKGALGFPSLTSRGRNVYAQSGLRKALNNLHLGERPVRKHAGTDRRPGGPDRETHQLFVIDTITGKPWTRIAYDRQRLRAAYLRP